MTSNIISAIDTGINLVQQAVGLVTDATKKGDDKDYRIDLLFYHLKLHSYVVCY